MKRYNKNKYPFIYVKDSGDLYFLKTINGVRYKRSLGSKKIREAHERAEKIENELRKQFNSSDFNRSERIKKGINNPSIKDLWEEFKQDKFPRVEQSTRNAYNYQWKNNISHFWENKFLKDLNQQSVKKWEVWFLKHRSNINYVSARKILMAFYNYLFKNKYIFEKIEFEALDKTTLKSESRSRVKLTFSRSELKKICSYGREPFSIIFKIAVFTGARRSEITKLKCSQIKSVNGILHINFYSFKNKKYRLVMVDDSISDKIVNQLQAAKKLKKTYLFFPTSNVDTHVSATNVDRHFGLLLSSLGLNRGKKVFHDIRRTFASMTAEQNWPPLVACAILDMSLNIYQKVYCKISEESKIEAIKSLSIDDFKSTSIKILEMDVEDG